MHLYNCGVDSQIFTKSSKRVHITSVVRNLHFQRFTRPPEITLNFLGVGGSLVFRTQQWLLSKTAATALF